MKPLELLICRDLLETAKDGREGFTLGKIYSDNVCFGETLEDEDRFLEAGGVKIPGQTAMPLGRYRLSLYASPKHGEVPLFHDVPQFTYTEIHKANRAEELRGCVAVGRVRTLTGVADCQIVLSRIVRAMQRAEDELREVFCTIRRNA